MAEFYPEIYGRYCMNSMHTTRLYFRAASPFSIHSKRDYKMRKITHLLTRDSTTKLHFIILSKTVLKTKWGQGQIQEVR